MEGNDRGPSQNRAGISDATIALLQEDCRRAPPGAFVDLGTGEGISLKTMLDAGPGRTIWTVDDAAMFSNAVERRLAGRGRDLRNVRFVHAPLEECKLPGIRQNWYRCEALGEIPAPVGLLFVDGPIGHVGRLPALPCFRGRLGRGSIILLDDCNPQWERETLQAWMKLLEEWAVPHRSEILKTDRGLGRIVLG